MGAMNSKALLLLLIGFLAGAVAVNSIPSRAQPYIGGALGYSKAYFPPTVNPWATAYEQHTAAPQAIAFAGYQAGPLAIEVGKGSLSRYASHNVGVAPTGPFNIRQEIATNMVYARALAGVPIGRWQPFVSAGLARVKMKNYEYGYNDPSLQFVEHRNDDTRTRPLLGAGLKYALNDHISLRAEATYITHIAVSQWTGEQNVMAAWVGISTKF